MKTVSGLFKYVCKYFQKDIWNWPLGLNAIQSPVSKGNRQRQIHTCASAEQQNTATVPFLA